jgi:glycine betaine catabolism B
MTTFIEELDEALICTEIRDVTHDVKSFTLESVEPQQLQFDAGQYLTVTADIDGEAVERCYTISSPPTRPGALTITVKRVPGGPVSNWLHDRLAVGDKLHVSGPLGRFSMSHHRAQKYVFLSAGSGITPLMSMTRTLCDQDDPADLIFVHNARTPRDIIFREELGDIAARPNMHVLAICEASAPTEEWNGISGRLSLPTLLEIAPDLTDREIFMCGPTPYMNAVRNMLGAAGVDPQRYHEESFDLGGTNRQSAPTETTPSCASPGSGYAVEFQRSGTTFDCAPNETILDAALRNGLNPPSSCAEGVCGTCKSMVVSGTVDMAHAGGIRPREIAENKILICCTTPLEDLIIDL